jgi:hypothetical protein
MELEWTPWAQVRLLPIPGRDAFDLDTSDTLTLGDMPFEELLEFGIAQRAHERYNEKGNHPNDKHGDNLVDTCVATGGVELATKFLVEVCGKKDHYKLRRDAGGWRRLRQHLAAAPEEQRAAAKTIAAQARRLEDERREAVAFAFCDPEWVNQDLEESLEDGYGKLALLTSLSTPEQARGALARLLGKDGQYSPPYQLVEEAVDFMPNLMRTLDASDVGLVLEAAAKAWNKAVRKPWLEIVACLPLGTAKAFLAEHGYDRPLAKGSKPTKAPLKKKPLANKKSAAKNAPKKQAAAKKAVAKKKPASKKASKKKR